MVSLCPNFLRAMARITSWGITRNRSVTRMTSWSVQPRKKPASEPRATPMTVEMNATDRPIFSEICPA